jgi:hypothetical protein
MPRVLGLSRGESAPLLAWLAVSPARAHRTHLQQAVRSNTDSMPHAGMLARSARDVKYMRTQMPCMQAHVCTRDPCEHANTRIHLHTRTHARTHAHTGLYLSKEPHVMKDIHT